MLQQLLALLIIVYFLIKLFWQKHKNQINSNEFKLWLLFWILSSIAVVFIKKIDALASSLGFTGAGIDILLYFSIALLFYLIFRLNIKQERIEREITKIVRYLSINSNNKDKL